MWPSKKKPKKSWATNERVEAVEDRVDTLRKDISLDETSDRSLRDRVASLERRMDNLTERIVVLESLIS